MDSLKVLVASEFEGDIPLGIGHQAPVVVDELEGEDNPKKFAENN